MADVGRDMQVPSQSPRRVLEFDALRGIAALWVVLFHFTFGVGWTWDRIDLDIAPTITPITFNLEGLAAVWLFFIISGFVIFMTLRRCRTVVDFAITRVARLYPGYWAALTITSILVISNPLPEESVSAGKILANFTMFNELIGFSGIDTVYWSLTFELVFYGWIALLFALSDLERIELVGTIFVAGTMLAHLFLPIMSFLPWRVQTLLLIPYSPLFLAGIMLYRSASDGLTLRRTVILLLCYGLFTWHRRPIDFMLVGGVFAVCTASALGHARALAVAPLVWLGKISYSLYIIHAPLGARTQLLLAAWGVPPWLNLVTAMATVLLAAWVLHTVVELPGGRFIRSRKPLLLQRLKSS